MATQIEVHVKGQVLLDEARKLPDGMYKVGSNEMTPDPLRVAVEQAVTEEHQGLSESWRKYPTRRLRPYDETDPMEADAWCGRLQAIARLSGEHPNMLRVAIWKGNVLAALDAAIETVREVR